jgi:hypothetical protein
MSSPNSSELVIVYPVYAADQDHRGFLQSLKNFASLDGAPRVVAVSSDGEATTGLKNVASADAVEFQQVENLSFGPLVNEFVTKYPQAILAFVPELIEVSENYSEAVKKTFAEADDIAAVFGCYNQPTSSGDLNKVIVSPIEKPQHERNDYGYLMAYSASAIEAAGKADTSFKLVAEYELQLRLVEKGRFGHIEEPTYKVLKTAEELNKAKDHFHVGKGLNPDQEGWIVAPGRPKNGGFSYLFYPPELDTEINDAFINHLKREGAYSDHQPEKVPYPSESTYEVKASVVIPVLNRASFIGKAIASVQAGTFKDFEVVVVDNGSTDGSPDVVKEISEKDPRIRLIEQRGPHIASALNRGIKEARGKYICQLDSDDVYVPETLERMVGHFESHPYCGLAISYYGLIDPDGKPLPELGLIRHLGYGRNVIVRRDGGGALRVFPKCVLEEMGLYDEENFGNFGEDYDMVLKVGEKYEVNRVHAELYRYRRHPDNTDVTRDPRMKVWNKNRARLDAIERRRAYNEKHGRKHPL